MKKTIYGKARIAYLSGKLEEWKELNPVLLSGEFGIVTNGNENEKVKIGDGVTPWNELDWWKGPKGNQVELRKAEATKNLLPYPFVEISVHQRMNDDITIIDNKDGSITFKGDISKENFVSIYIYYNKEKLILKPNENYTFSLNPESINATYSGNFYPDWSDGNPPEISLDGGSFVYTEGSISGNSCLHISFSDFYENAGHLEGTIKPQLELGSNATEWESYTGLNEPYIQWKYDNENEWKNLLPLSEITGDKSEDGITPIIDQTYRPESENAQSGVAVDQAVQFAISGAEGLANAYTDFAISQAITQTLNTEV